MKISKLTVRRLSISSAPWYGGEVPPGEPDSFQFPLLEIATDEGVTGHSMGYCPLGQGRGASYALVDVYSRLLIGRDPLRHEELWQDMRRLHRHLYHFSDANWGVVNVALWDLKGKVLGQPIAVLLGLRRTSIPAYGTGSYFLLTPEAMADEAQRIRDRGYHGAKFNLFDGPKRDIPRLTAAREAVGPDFPLMHDASSFYSFTDALEVGRALDRLGYRWFEEPMYDRHLSRVAELARQLDTPILAAETVGFAELGEYLRHGAADLVRSDVLIKPGVTGLKKTVDACEVMGVGCEVHTCASPLLDLANLQVALASSNCPWMECHHDMFRFGLKNRPLDIGADGLLHLPPGPGLGAELDWDWIEDHTAEVIG